MSDDVARLLAHPLRQLILLEYGEANSPSKVAHHLQRPVNLVSYHTDVLRSRGWIELIRTERRRGATEHFYRATEPPSIEDEEWERISLPLRHAIVLGTLGAASDEARGAALQGGFDEASAHLSRWPVELDDEGVTEVAALLRGVIDRLEHIETASRERNSASAARYEVVAQFFRLPDR